ncbi:unnamed protein product [Closterium sp. NIES-65]|nr:unnamed protein product [Closterium sp. NIES-65]
MAAAALTTCSPSLPHCSCPLHSFPSPHSPPSIPLPPCPHGADLKSMAAAALTSCHLHHPPSSASHSPRILCLGLGGGSLPLFLAHALPFCLSSSLMLYPGAVRLSASLTLYPGAVRLSASLTLYPVSPTHPPATSHPLHEGSGTELDHFHLRTLCLGLGGGSLPLCLAHALPSAHVDAVEIDPAVIAAAMRHMGFPEWAMRTKTKPFSGSKAEGETEALALGGMPLPEDQAAAAAAAERVLWQGLYGRVAVYNEDAVSFVLRAAERIGRGGGDGESGRRGEGERADAGDREEQQEPYDLVLVDVFDGSDETPPELLDRNSPFLRVLAQVVHPKHGTVVVSVMNVHADVPPPSLWERVTGRFGDGWADETLPSSLPSALPSLPGQHDPGSAARGGAGGNGAREGERLSPETHTARQSGIGFTTTTPSQGNMTLVVQRGVVLEGGGGNRQAELEGRLKEGAAAVEEEGAVPFTVAPRVVRGLKVLPVEWCC